MHFMSCVTRIKYARTSVVPTLFSSFRSPDSLPLCLPNALARPTRHDLLKMMLSNGPDSEFSSSLLVFEVIDFFSLITSGVFTYSCVLELVLAIHISESKVSPSEFAVAATAAKVS